jgi:shikimate dehydrogenase
MNKTPLMLGLLGYPVEHSLSPVLHKTALTELGLNGDYQLFSVPEPLMLEDYCVKMRHGLIHGLNITIPWKTRIIDSLDKLTQAAHEIGAVNTIFLQDGKLIGDNTDAIGFKEDLIASFGLQFVNTPKIALILGAGGAARAVCWTLCRLGWKVHIAARRLDQAQAVQSDFSGLSCQIKTSELSPAGLAGLSPELLINTTPVGMNPNCNASPWPKGLPLPRRTRFYDLVYYPAETQLLLNARANGHLTNNGAGMLISQAAASFQLWTGHEPPRKMMSEALHQAVSNIERII